MQSTLFEVLDEIPTNPLHLVRAGLVVTGTTESVCAWTYTWFKHVACCSAIAVASWAIIIPFRSELDDGSWD